MFHIIINTVTKDNLRWDGDGKKVRNFAGLKYKKKTIFFLKMKSRDFAYHSKRPRSRIVTAQFIDP